MFQGSFIRAVGRTSLFANSPQLSPALWVMGVGGVSHVRAVTDWQMGINCWHQSHWQQESMAACTWVT